MKTIENPLPVGPAESHAPRILSARHCPGLAGRRSFGPARKLAWLAAIAIALGSAADAQAKGNSGPQKGSAEPTALRADRPVRAEVDMDSGGRVGFKTDVPDDAVLMTIKVTHTPVGLDVMVAKDQPAESPRDAEHVASPTALDTTLRVSCQSLKPLESGTYYIDVGWLNGGMAVTHKRPIKKIPFTVTVSFMRAKVESVIKPGEKTAGKICDEDGSLKIYAIDVPPGAKVLRIDLDDTDGDLDLFATPGKIVSHANAALDTALSPLSRETLLIDESSPQPLKPGRWYVCVVKPQEECANHFAMYATFSPAPPAALLAIPDAPPPRDAKQRAILATVDVSTEFAGGSGTVLSEDGLILTNYHLIAEVAENPKDGEDEPVVIGLTIDPHNPPRELFRGKVVAFNKDVDFALIQVDCGFYRQPLPKGYRFVTIPLGDPAKQEIGNTIWAIGYPVLGGSNGRASITLTRGVLSGFEEKPIGTMFKTDANIGSGNSGGAAVDRNWQLIGVPSYHHVDPEDVSSMSYIHSIALLPKAWRQTIEQRTRKGK
jgi:S1-C subfamily serine protease